jgi:intein/homing endonuclease
VLEKLNIFLKTDKKIRNNNKNSSKVVIENKKISNDLIKNGLVQSKTHILRFPIFIQENLIRHFIRGYFDGDGCITYGKKLNKNCQISITSTLNFLKQIDKYININFGYTKRHKERDNEIYTIISGGVCNLMTFYNYLYKDSTIYLDRKKLKFENWFKYYFDNVNISKKTKEIKNKLQL